MLRVFVDSGSSIKQEEKEKYQVEIIPLKIILGDKEYYDGINLTNKIFTLIWWIIKFFQKLPFHH